MHVIRGFLTLKHNIHQTAFKFLFPAYLYSYIYEALAKLTNFGSSVFAFGYAVTGRTDTTGELLHIY